MNKNKPKVSGFIEFSPTLKIRKADKAGTLKCLTAIRNLFGNKGQYWTTGVGKETTEEGFNRFCLVGAAAEVNGKFEPQARAAISLAILRNEDEEPDLCSVDSEETIINYNDVTAASFADIRKILKTAKELVRKV
jgi:hypothetical protein